jgi:hypothetical protein
MARARNYQRNEMDEMESKSIASDSTTSAPITPVPEDTTKLPSAPSVFRIRDGKTTCNVMPVALVQGVARDSLTIKHLSLGKFWNFIEKETGSNPQTCRLLAEVSHECEQAGKYCGHEAYHGVAR